MSNLHPLFGWLLAPVTPPAEPMCKECGHPLTAATVSDENRRAGVCSSVCWMELHCELERLPGDYEEGYDDES